MVSLTNSSTVAGIKDVRVQYKYETRTTSGFINTGDRVVYHCQLTALVFDLVRKYSNGREGGGGGVDRGDSYKNIKKKSRDTLPQNVVYVLKVSCDGGGGALGHPKIFINLDPSGPQACNYCGLRFEMDHSHAHH
jgi:uncharacterized Zn-finger protein